MQTYVQKYLIEKDIEFKDGPSNQLILKRCLMCGDDKHHFYMDRDEGLWDCKKCGMKGNLNQFRKTLGDAEIDLGKIEKSEGKQIKNKEYRTLTYTEAQNYASRLISIDTHYLDYLIKERDLSEEVIKKFKLGSNGTHISIPIYEDGKLVNIRYRRDPRLDESAEAGPKYTQEKNCKPALFNGDILNEPRKTIYVTEGEFDAMLLIKKGILNTISVTLGANCFLQDWVDKFKDVTTIYLVYDNDEAGKSGAKVAAEKLGFDRCRNVVLPKKSGRKKTDITNYFNDDGYTKTDFLELVKNSKRFTSIDDESIKHISEFNEKLRENIIEGEYFGEPSGYDLLDEAMGGLRKGRLVIISGLTNTGKTSFALNIAMNLSHRKLPIFYFSMEMPPIDIAKKVLMLEAKLTNKQLKDIEDPSPELDEVDKTLATFSSNNGKDFPMYLYNGSGQVKYTVFTECARVVKEEYNCQAIFVDHLHYFVQNYGNLTAETSKLVRDIKQLAIQLDLPIVLLAHLNRGGRAKSRKGMYTPSLADLRDTGAIEQDADQVLFVCRDSENPEPEEREKAFIKVAKNRDGMAGRNISMRFDENITTFIECTQDVDYAEEARVEEEELGKEVDLIDPDLPF